jgi:thiamine kinase-like enzyme
MSSGRSLRAVLENIPGWEEATCSPLSGGLSNRAYLLEKNGARAVLKMDDEARAMPYNTRADEARVQTIAAESHLANRVLYFDECAYLTEYLDGHVWSRTELGDEQNIVQFAAALKSLHALPLTGRTFDASDAVVPYLAKIDSRYAERARRFADVVLSKSQPANLCCCHNDLVAENVVATPELLFLDWEYACDNDPFFDIATVITHHDLSSAQESLFLNSYFAGDGERWRAQLHEQKYVYDALHWLWLAAQENVEDNLQLLDRLATRLESETYRNAR